MRRATGIGLVLLGGGLVLGLPGCERETEACREARAEGRLKPDEACGRAGARSGTSSSPGGSWLHAITRRAGFGSTASAASVGG